MQLFEHKLTTLTVPQKYFIERAIELLYRGTIDSYRVRVKNPKSILQEIKLAIEAFEKGQIKHFISIAGKEGAVKDKPQFALKDEALTLSIVEPNYLVFNTFSKLYFLTILKGLSETNYKQLKNCLAILLRENINYTEAVISGLKDLLVIAPSSNEEMFILLGKIDRTINFLFTELLDSGFSKGFLYRHIYGLFINSLVEGENFNDKFSAFETRIKLWNNNYSIIFRIDTTKKVKTNIKSTLETMLVCNDIDDVQPVAGNEFGNFKVQKDTRTFIKCLIEAPDYLAALKKAKALLAENLDLLNLGYSDEFLLVHPRVLVIDNANPGNAAFQHSANFLDGKYKVARDHYLHFIEKVPIILSNPLVAKETKEKIKSAIRYLRLGNQSTEVEHKFINYWIGLEYLFSNYDSNNTISRIKDYFVVCHSLVYVKRNLFYFYGNVSDIDDIILATIRSYNIDPIVCLANPDFYTEVADKLLSTYPLIAERAYNLSQKISIGNANKQLEEYIEQHRKNLIIHLTRIYRLRNEIVHDAATNTNNENVVANLRYYLTFALNGIIDFLCGVHEDEVTIEDYFTLSEIHLGNLKHKGWALTELLNVPSSIDFIS